MSYYVVAHLNHETNTYQLKNVTKDIIDKINDSGYGVIEAVILGEDLYSEHILSADDLASELIRGNDDYDEELKEIVEWLRKNN